MKFTLRAILISTILATQAGNALAQDSGPPLLALPSPTDAPAIPVPNGSGGTSMAPMAPLPSLPEQASAPVITSNSLPALPTPSGSMQPVAAGSVSSAPSLPVLPPSSGSIQPSASANPPSAPALPSLSSLPSPGVANTTNPPAIPKPGMAPVATNVPNPPPLDNGMKELKLPDAKNNMLQPLPLPNVPGTSATDNPLPLPNLPGAPTMDKPMLAPVADTTPATPVPNTSVKTEVAAVNPAMEAMKKSKDKPGKVDKGKGKKKHANYAKKEKEEPSVLYATIKDRLPEEIYKKKYDVHNRHLPLAYYEKDYDNFMFVAVRNDDINGLRSFMHQGRNINMVDKDGDTPLLVAVKYDAINTAHLLMKHHADINIADHDGLTPIQVAERDGNFRMIDLLRRPVSE